MAGQVNQVQPIILQQLREADMAAAAPQMKVQQEAAFEYHLYTLERPATIAENQTKQVALMSASAIPVSKEYRFVRAVNEQDWQFAEPQRVNATVRLSFENTAAAHLGHDDVVRELIAAGAPLDHVNNLGWTALIEAVMLGNGGPRHVATVKALVAAGARRDLADREGTTPLEHARRRGYAAMVALLQ